MRNFSFFAGTEISTAIANKSTVNVTYAYLYDNLTEYFLKWYLPTVLTTGFVGSAFCLMFLLRSKHFPPNMRIWLISICIGDFVILLLEGVWMLLKVWCQFDIRDVNNTLCIIHSTASNYFFYWSAYVQCLVSLQRCYIIWNPLQVQTRLLSIRHLIFCLIVVSLLLLVPTLPYPIFWRVIHGDCDPVTERVFRLTTLLDLIFWGFIPVALMTTSTIIIWHNLLQRSQTFDATGKFLNTQSGEGKDIRKRQSLAIVRVQNRVTFKCSSSESNLKGLGLQNLDSSGVGNTELEPNCSQRSMSADAGDRATRRKAVENHYHVTLILICMNFVYMTSVLPLITYLFCLNFIFQELDKDIHRFIYYLFRSFCFLNACTNWIFYCVSGTKFRRLTTSLLARTCYSNCCRHSVTRTPRLPSTQLMNTDPSKNQKHQSFQRYSYLPCRS
ncbi:uncharacterized protein DEA37_0003871 [Paragonimus westermani]|uniref:G-protein coupled receptors family 1 profile domain-containing protein n=1 Tax=Paragonimus westermani TaxID=34504 RepID=A0A5J4P3J6_9TREM|nr:uncharacterized protein DEA37_0003871 [Paragonimus westermani]